MTCVGTGKVHNFSAKTRLGNLKSLVKESPPLINDQLVSSLLTEKASSTEMKNLHKNSSISLSQCAVKLLKVLLNPENKRNQTEKSLITTDNMKRIQACFNLTQNKTLGIASMIRVATGYRNIIEPNLKPQLSTGINCLTHFFTYKEFNFTKVIGNLTSESKEVAVYCKDL